MTTSSQIIWAVDPTQNPAEAKTIVKELKTWAKYLNCDIQPVTIVSKSILNFPIEMGFPEKEKLEEAMKKSLKNYLKHVQIKDFLTPEFVYIPWVSTRKMAMTLAKYAKKKDAILIFVYTRAKKTRNPFRFGGFAEALVNCSHVPVVLLNPFSLASNKISSILFPTDFSREAKSTLLKLEPWIKLFKAKLLLYNQLETPNIYPGDMYDAWSYLTLNIETMMKDLKKLRTEKAQSWLALLKKHHINCAPVIEQQKSDLSADIIETADKNKTNLIALYSRSGLITQTIIGSVPQDVILQAKCPVLIFHRSS